MEIIQPGMEIISPGMEFCLVFILALSRRVTFRVIRQLSEDIVFSAPLREMTAQTLRKQKIFYINNV